jgi:hypothetical protein
MLIIKNSHHALKVSAFSFMLLMALNTYADQLLSFEGKAVDLETLDLLYTENHQVILNDAGDYLSAFVTYINPDGDIFAEKTLDYGKNSLAPDMTFYDKRSGERTHVTLNAADANFHVLIETDKKRSESKVKLDDSLVVVDSGFDRMIESRWRSFRKDKGLEFTFLAITRSRLINFEATEVKANDVSVTIELNPRNFFINLLLDPIALEYDIINQRLLSFEGISNIEVFENGQRTEKNHVARIDYKYQPLKALSINSFELIQKY